METSQLGMVPVTDSELERNKFPLKKNLFTSCGFGEVSPCRLREVPAGTKSKFKTETLCYLASVNAPTYGNLHLDYWHYFVNYSDLSTVMANLFAQTAVSGGLEQRMIQPEKVIYAPRNFLSALVLMYSHCTVYPFANGLGQVRTYSQPIQRANDQDSYLAMNSAVASLKSWCDYYKQGDSSMLFYGDESGTAPDVYSKAKCSRIGLGVLIDGLDPSTGHNAKIPLSNPSGRTFFEMQDADGKTATRDFSTGIDIAPVTVDGADFIIERYHEASGDYPGGGYMFCFRLHGFGARLYKVLKGIGFEFDFTSTEPVSLMPLFAVYKAYFDCFGLTLYQNYQYTACARILKNYDNSAGQDNNFAEFFGISAWKESLARDFINELGSMWFTSSQDFVSSHTKTPNVSMSPSTEFLQSIGPHVGPNGEQTPSVNQLNTTGSEDDPVLNYHAFIDRVVHGQIDCELLKREYLRTNRETIAGKRMEQLLRMKGYGKWVDSCKPRFIGHASIPVDFSQVISTANTLNGNNGAIVGERGGRGQAYGESKSFFYKNDEPGYLISLIAVVPDAGYTQSMNTAFDCVHRDDFYQKMYDGLGMELNKIRLVCGDMPVKVLNEDNSENLNVTEQSFGYAARFNKFKVEMNTYSGIFARRSTRISYLTYSTDKFIDLGEVIETSNKVVTTGGIHREVERKCIFPVNEFPLAGMVWRYPTRYPWLGHFTRIFAAVGDDSSNFGTPLMDANFMFNAYEYLNNEMDGFAVMATFSGMTRAPMLAVSDSFETLDEGNKGHISENIAKS